MIRVNRKHLFSALESIGVEQGFTTSDVCERLGATDAQVKGVMAWCIKAGLIQVSGSVQRRDCQGRPYRANIYQWTGGKRIRRETQITDPVRRWFGGIKA